MASGLTRRNAGIVSMTRAWSPWASHAMRSRSAWRASGVRMWTGSDASWARSSLSFQNVWLIAPLASRTTRRLLRVTARPMASPTSRKSSVSAVCAVLTLTHRSSPWRNGSRLVVG